MNERGSLFDTSVWLALSFSAHKHHAHAQEAFRAASVGKPACFCRATQQSLLRLLTTAAIAKGYGVPTPTNHEALAILDGFMAAASVRFVEEPSNTFARWRLYADLPSASPKRWMDAYISPRSRSRPG